MTDGPVRFTRNPMYLGFTLVLVAVALFVRSLTAWVGRLAFFVAASLWYIPFEEARMGAGEVCAASPAPGSWTGWR